MLGPADIPTAFLIALIADVLIGDPAWLYRRTGHPVEWLGASIAWADRRFNRESDAPAIRLANGGWLIMALVAGSLLLGWLVQSILLWLPWGTLWLGIVASSLVAARSLRDHVQAVERALLHGKLEEGRAAVAQIVGRDAKVLDEAGVSRGAIESLAENYSDAVVAPLFWGVLLGLPGLIAYKAINTADSMIGHRNPRYREFGKAAAGLDDIVNFIPARLAGAMICLGAFLLPGARPGEGWASMLRDAPRHRSPNAGWPEAAMAGALGLRLIGPRSYDGERVAGDWMGDGRFALKAADIRTALKLYRAACGVQLGVLALLFALTFL